MVCQGAKLSALQRHSCVCLARAGASAYAKRFLSELSDDGMTHNLFPLCLA